MTAAGLPGPTPRPCAECGDFQSGDPGGLCYSCRIAQPGYRARQTAQVREFVIEDNKHLAQMGLAPHRAPQVQRDDPGPFRFFWAQPVMDACPECELPAPAGFDRHDPELETREATRCAACSAERIEWAAHVESGSLGYPPAEQGPCATCREPTHRYGAAGKPLCPGCEAGAGVAPRATGPAEARPPETAEIESRELEMSL